MIKDNIQNAEKYYTLSERIKLGLEYLKNTDLAALEIGRYEILGNEVFVNVQDYLSKDENDAKFEAHKNYIDIQYVIEGEEKIGVCDVRKLSPYADYDAQTDIVFFTKDTSQKTDFIKLNFNEFVILSTNDAHMPSVCVKSPSKVKKAVVKVLV